jgi:hypothetical protein
MTSRENIAYGVRVQRELTVALKIESVRMTSHENIANGVREATVANKKELIKVTSSDIIANDVNVQKGGFFCAKRVG